MARALVDIAAGDACYLTGAMSGDLPSAAIATGAAANAAAVVEGFAAAAASAGDPVTLYRNDIHMHYGAGLTPGNAGAYYLSGTVPGGLDTVASVGGTAIIARAITASSIRVFGNL